MTELKTRPELLTALSEAAQTKLSGADLHRQRVSFVMSSLTDGNVTRERVDQVVGKQDGSRPD